MKTNLLIGSVIGLFAVACSQSGDEPKAKPLQAPSEITVVQTDESAVTVSWKDNSESESGFSIWMKPAEDAEAERLGFTGPDVESYTVSAEKIESGKPCYFGVRADGPTRYENSEIVYAPRFVLEDLSQPGASFVGDPVSTEACIALRYNPRNLPAGAVCGICWSADSEPTADGPHQDGPAVADGSTVLQVVSNVLLEYGVTYRFRAYVRTDNAIYYSAECSAKLAEEPGPITLSWKKLDTGSLPAAISVYETSDKLNGRNFHAWYAVADLSEGTVEVRVNVPDNLATIDDQAASFGGACCIMTNGGYFYNTSHVGLAFVGSKPVGYIPQIQGSLRDDEENKILYNVTRGIFGVNASGSPAVRWVGTSNSVNYFFDRPLPSVKGEAKYGPVSASRPTTSLQWSPTYAISAGPVLLKDGKCPFDFTETDKGTEYYLNNYEIIPYDIFGPTVRPDRTAVGRTADGKVILFICDGRISASDGATLTELARILKGLGCVEALNLDGGGSTGMMVGTDHVNDLTGGNRKVKSTIGFFKK